MSWGRYLFRVAALVLVVAAVVLWRAGEEPIHALKTPELRPAPQIFERPQRMPEELQRIRIGSFERPEDVPAYEVLEEVQTGSDGARSAQLLVDTRSRSQEDFTLITRDLKARYADYDVVSIEFTDSSVVLAYHGGAIIFNTPVGAERAGYIYGAPDEGYYVMVEK